MAPIDLNHLRSFLDVVETGSFTLAGRRAGVPRSTVSRAIVALERTLGVTLFHRTTRRVTTTNAGRVLAARVGTPLATLAASLDLPDRKDEPAGEIRVTATLDVGTALLADAAGRFTARYPRAAIDLRLTNQVVDLVGGGFDLAVRVLAKPLRDSTLIARRLGTLAIGLYAAPAYLARRGTPQREADLAEHEGVRFGNRLAFGKGARIACDDMLVTRELLRRGAGIGALPSFLAEPEVAAGTLVRVVPRWDLRGGIVYLVQPGRPRATRTRPNVTVSAFAALLTELAHSSGLAAG